MAVALTILTRRIPDPQESLGFSAQMRVAGGIAPYSWQVVAGFGSLPLGMSLSAAGVLSAPPLAIPPTAVGTYSFRIEVTDALPTTVFLDYTIKVLPSGYDTVPDWLVDPALRSLAGRLADDPVDREKAEIHFFRGIIGVMGEYYAHYDEDIYCPDWRVPGNNVNLRDALEAVYLVAFGSIRTINTIPPDGTSDFKIQAGTGITLTPLVNGFEIASAAAMSQVKHYSAAGIVNSMMELSLLLTSAPHLVQGWYHEPVEDRWYDIGNVPDSGSKKLPSPVDAADWYSIAMAPGWDNVYLGGTGVLHVLCCTLGQWSISRFQANSMDLIQTFVLDDGFGSPSGNQASPILMTGPNNEVFVALIDSSNQLWYAVLDSSDYTNAAAPYVPVPAPYLAIPATVWFKACVNGPRLIGCVDPTALGGTTYAYIGCVARIGGGPVANDRTVIIELVSLGGLTWAPTGTYYESPFGGATATSLLDMIVDDYLIPQHHIVTFGLEQVQGAGFMDNFDAWYLPCSPIVGVGSVPLPIPPMPNQAWNIEAAYPGDTYRHGCVGLHIKTGVAPAFCRGAVFGYTRVYNSNPDSAGPRAVIIDQIQQAFPAFTIGISPSNATSSIWPVNLVDWGLSIFERQILTPGFNSNDIFFFEADPGVNSTSYKRWRLSGEYGWIDSPVEFCFRAGSSSKQMRPSSTFHTTFEDMRPFIYFSDNTLFYGDPLFQPEDLRMEYRPATSEAVIVNNSLFSWDVRIDSIEVPPSYSVPENLIIACYQFSEAMKRYHDAATWFPSPSTIPGVQVNWTEAQVATTNVGGFQFDSYYSVTPGAYDLYAGSVAQGRYFADEAAGLAQDYTFVFRYNVYPPLITAAEAAIKAALDNYLVLTPPLPHGTGVNPNYYTLPEVDALLLTSFATTYAGPPYDYYRYFLFTNTDGLSYEHGYFSQNYVDTGVAYGPHPASGLSIPVAENFTVTVPGAGNTSDFFTLSTSVSAAMVYVNGIMYLEGIEWRFSGMNVIEYFNRQPFGFVLTVGSVVTVMKWNL